MAKRSDPRPDQRRDALRNSIARALEGDRAPLFDLLARNSGLPGVRANVPFAQDFALLCASLGSATDALLTALATLDADYARGGTALEFVPVCGVLGLAERAALDDAAFEGHVAVLQDAAEDLRFRVREATIIALVRVGSARGDVLVRAVEPWMDGYFQAAAVLEAVAQPKWLDTLSDLDALTARLDAAYRLAKTASRAAARYPGRKALVEALGKAPRACAARFGVPIFDLLVKWTETREPDLRDAIAQNLTSKRLAGRFAQELARVRLALDTTAPTLRDPTDDFGPTRHRSKHPKGPNEPRRR